MKPLPIAALVIVIASTAVFIPSWERKAHNPPTPDNPAYWNHGLETAPKGNATEPGQVWLHRQPETVPDDPWGVSATPRPAWTSVKTVIAVSNGWVLYDVEYSDTQPPCKFRDAKRTDDFTLGHKRIK